MKTAHCVAASLVVMTMLGASALQAQTIKGKLEAANQIHSVELKKGGVYTIDMKSKEFDTFLTLNDAEGNKVAENDDVGGSDLNSRIVFTPKDSGKYQVVASSFQKDGRGDYELMIRAWTPAGKAIVNKGKISDKSPVLGKIPFQPFKMKLVAGTAYQIDLVSSDFDALLGIRVVGVNAPIALDDDSGGDLNSRLVFIPDKNAEYEVMAGSLDGQPGAFTLTIQEFRAALASYRER